MMKELEIIKARLLQPASIRRKARQKAGYRILFAGNADAEKAAASERLSHETGRPIHRVALSRIVSKYIGETEKNLRVLFDEAAEKGWILYFDEGEALLRKRTTVKDSHDRYANRMVKAFLEKLEDYPGVVVLSVNDQKSFKPGTVPFEKNFDSVARFHSANK